jgi:hypothetical protein
MLKQRQETTFIIISILLLVATVAVIIYSINFLVTEIKLAFEQNSASAPFIIKFNLEGLKELGIIK